METRDEDHQAKFYPGFQVKSEDFPYTANQFSRGQKIIRTHLAYRSRNPFALFSPLGSSQGFGICIPPPAISSRDSKTRDDIVMGPKLS